MNDLFIQGISLHWDKVGKDSYLREIAAFQGLDQIRFNKPVTFFAGENGSGKSTLLEAIAVAHGFNPEGGTRNYNFSTRDTHSELCDAITVAKGYRRERWGYFLRAESFYNVATQEEQYADAAHPSALYHEKSHGESFLQLAQNNLRGDGLYFFDEPEAALSPLRQLSLLRAMRDLVCAQSQFIIATHSPILMAYPGAEIFTFGEDGIHSVSYEETEHYQITRTFLENPARMLRELFAETDEGD